MATKQELKQTIRKLEHQIAHMVAVEWDLSKNQPMVDTMQEEINALSRENQKLVRALNEKNKRLRELRDEEKECQDLRRLLGESEETIRTLRSKLADQTYRLDVAKRTYDFFVDVATKVDQLRNKETKI